MVVPGVPQHVTQRGNRCQQTFFCSADYEAYMELMADWCRRGGVAVWAYCLMPNHMHLIVVPSSENGLRRAIGEAHRRYTRRVSFRGGWRGHLWQGRFASFPMDEARLRAATRYVELNPVRAKLVVQAEEYRWSSAAAHMAGRDDDLAQVAPSLQRYGDWTQLLSEGASAEEAESFRQHERTGRSLGPGAFVESLERRLGRTLRPQKPGPRRAGQEAQSN